MRFRNAFDVPLPPDRAWAVLMDIQRIVPCMPGASLTRQVDDRTYQGNVMVRLGPVALTFAGTATFEEIDPAARTARVKAAGTDAKGRGGANSTVSFAVTPSETGSQVTVDTDLMLSGAVAQYGRGAGMIQDVAAQLIKQFAGSLREQLAAEQEPIAPVQAATPGAPPPSRPARPISGLSLMLTAFWRSLLRLFGQHSAT